MEKVFCILYFYIYFKAGEISAEIAAFLGEGSHLNASLASKAVKKLVEGTKTPPVIVTSDSE